ncbi:MAG TPA: ribosome maturation factor RimM [Gemmatimonadaceae bacterium]|nr:ribosome maturation factor RimM [Gemmatimonadaceae bacterium]
MSDASSFSVVGRVRRAHGVKGEVVVEVLTDAPGDLFAPGARLLALTRQGAVARDRAGGAPLTLTVRTCRPVRDGLLVTFDGIGGRAEAERWRHRALAVPDVALAPLEEGELFLHELRGMRVVDSQGAELGRVAGWYAVPQGYILEVETARGTRGIPFNEAFVKRVDRAARELTVELPEGMLD